MPVQYCCWCDMPVGDIDIKPEDIVEIMEHQEALPPRIPLDVWLPGLRRLPD